jgi:hypothetical protein
LNVQLSSAMSANCRTANNVKVRTKDKNSILAKVPLLENLPNLNSMASLLLTTRDLTEFFNMLIPRKRRQY